MRNLWIPVFSVPLVISLTASEAAQDSAETAIQLHAKAPIYLGPLDDLAAEQGGLKERAQAGGDIDVYNVWPSFQDIKRGGSGGFELKGHSYQICKNRHRQLTFGSQIRVRRNDPRVEIIYAFKGARRGGDGMCTFDLPHDGYWVLECEAETEDFVDGYHKVTARHSITRGGSGRGTATSFYSVLNCN